MEIYQNTLSVLANQETELLIQLSTNQTSILCLAVQTLGMYGRYSAAIDSPLYFSIYLFLTLQCNFCDTGAKNPFKSYWFGKKSSIS